MDRVVMAWAHRTNLLVARSATVWIPEGFRQGIGVTVGHTLERRDRSFGQIGQAHLFACYVDKGVRADITLTLSARMHYSTRDRVRGAGCGSGRVVRFVVASSERA